MQVSEHIGIQQMQIQRHDAHPSKQAADSKAFACMLERKRQQLMERQECHNAAHASKHAVHKSLVYLPWEE